MSNTRPNSLTLGNCLTPLEQFYNNVEQFPERLCFVQPYTDGSIKSLSWSDVDIEVRAMAAYLKAQNFEAGSRIAIMSANCAHWIMADLAIWLAGHISVPLYPVLTANSIQQIMEHSQSKLIFIGKLENWPSMKSGIGSNVGCVHFPFSTECSQSSNNWDSIVNTSSGYQEQPLRPLDDLATIIYTSGTTGVPKGVMHSFRTLASVGILTGQLYQTDEQDRMLSYLPLAHAGERAAVQINQLYNGFIVYFTCSLETFADDLRRANPTLFFAVPRIWLKLQQRVFEQVSEKKLNLLLKLPIISSVIRKKLTTALGMSSVRIGISGAAPLSTSLLTWYQSLGIPILEGYAMSENFAYSHTSRIGEAKIGYVGTPNPMVECKIAEDGEIRIKSPSNMLGYYLEPELSRSAFDDNGYLHTGDKGEIDSTGRLKITGRIKELFKTSKGKYVAPAPIENLLSSCQQLEQVCVTGASLPQPIALVTLTEANQLEGNNEAEKQNLQKILQSLLKTTNEHLDPHEQISTIVVFNQQWSIENGFMTPTLKVKRPNLEKAVSPYFEQWCNNKSQIVFAKNQH